MQVLCTNLRRLKTCHKICLLSWSKLCKPKEVRLPRRPDLSSAAAKEDKFVSIKLESGGGVGRAWRRCSSAGSRQRAVGRAKTQILALVLGNAEWLLPAPFFSDLCNRPIGATVALLRIREKAFSCLRLSHSQSQACVAYNTSRPAGLF